MKGKKIIKTQYVLKLDEQEIKDLRRIVQLYGVKGVEKEDTLYASSSRLFGVLDILLHGENIVKWPEV